MVEMNMLLGVIICFIGIIAFILSIFIDRFMFGIIVAGSVLVLNGAIFLSVDRETCKSLGKPLMVQDIITGKDLVVKQVMGGGYTLVAEYAEAKKEDLRVVKDLPLLAQGTIFIVAEREGKKIIVIPSVKEAK